MSARRLGLSAAAERECCDTTARGVRRSVGVRSSALGVLCYQVQCSPPIMNVMYSTRVGADCWSLTGHVAKK